MRRVVLLALLVLAPVSCSDDEGADADACADWERFDQSVSDFEFEDLAGEVGAIQAEAVDAELRSLIDEFFLTVDVPLEEYDVETSQQAFRAVSARCAELS